MFAGMLILLGLWAAVILSRRGRGAVAPVAARVDGRRRRERAGL